MALNRKSIEALLQNRPLGLAGKPGAWTLYNVHSQQAVFKSSTLTAIRERITILPGI